MSRWSPFGPVSDLDCPEGMTCVSGMCVNSGPGILEHVNNEHVVKFDPADHITYKEYELTDDDHKKFDKIENRTKEQIEVAKKVYAKMQGPQAKHNIDDIVKQIEDIWVDRVADDVEREVLLYVTQEGLELFDKYVKEEFNKTKEIISPHYYGVNGLIV